MSRGGIRALEAVGLAITALAAQTVIRGLLDPDVELLWGGLTWAPGGRRGHLILLGVVALVAAVSGGWAHIRGDRTPDEPLIREIRSRETV